MQFVRPNIRSMHGYTPGEQPPAGTRVIKLNTNENAYPPSPTVMDAIRAIEPEHLRRYPNPTADAFRDVAAEVLGVDRDWIMAGNGSDDILTIVTRAFVPPGGVLAFPWPTYSLYRVLAQIEDAKTWAVDWRSHWTLPIEDLVETRAATIYVANPNAPSGTMVPAEDLSKLASNFNGALLIDEAYVDFADFNCLELVKNHPNVIISRTLSKAYSLAGLRFGYAIAQPFVIHELMKVKDSYNCDAISIAAATAAMKDQAYARDNWEKIKASRASMTSELRARKFEVLPSQANFVFARLASGDGRALYTALKDRGVLVRHFEGPNLSPYVRITIGTPEQNQALLVAMDDIVK